MSDNRDRSRRSFLTLLAGGGIAGWLATRARRVFAGTVATGGTKAGGGKSAGTGTNATTPGATNPGTTKPGASVLHPKIGTPPTHSRVAFVKTKDRADGVKRALALLELPDFHGKRVLLKPNLNSADKAPGSTHPDILRALVDELRARGAKAIVVADRSGMGNTQRVMDKMGVTRLAREMHFETMVLDALPAEQWVRVVPPGSHWQNGFPFARPALEADAVVSACCLKTHRYGGHFTLSLKNSVGLAGKRVPGDRHDYMHELHSTRDQRRMIAEINTAYAPAVVIMDAVDAFAEGGPDRGKLIHPGAVLASTDRVALDAVGVAMLRFHGTTANVSRGKIFEQEQIARAVELGLGVSGPKQIEIVAGDYDSRECVPELRKVLDIG